MLCTSRFSAPATPPPRNKKKKCSMVQLQLSRPSCPLRRRRPINSATPPPSRHQNVGHRQGQQNLPAECHQLVIAEARQRAAHPDVQKHERKRPAARTRRRAATACRNRRQTKQSGRSIRPEQNGRQAGHGEHVGVFGHEEHGELHRAVFGVVAGHQFGLRFRQVEGNAVGLREGRHR